MLRFVVIASLSLLLSGSLGAQGAPGKGGGDLMVAPTRIVFEGRTRAAEVTLVNAGQATATYRVFFENMVMTEDGKFIEAPKAPGSIGAEDLVRYSPRQVTLAPGAQQSVRMQLRKPAELPEGEYRSHMIFRAVPKPEDAPKALPGIKTAADPEGDKAIRVSIKAIFGVSIPVIVRHGQTHVAVKLADLKVLTPEMQAEARAAARREAQAKAAEAGPNAPPVKEAPEPPGKPDDTLATAITIEREGNQSVYGDLVLTWTAKGQAPVTVAKAGGLAVYHNVARRKVNLRLTEFKGKDLKGGTLKMAFFPMDGKKPMAEAYLDIP